MRNEAVVEQVISLAQPILEDMGFELVDLEYRQQGREWMLCLYIDKEGGVTLDDCAEFSRELSTVLDVEDVVPTAYRLEISSPGLDRPLKKAQDFTRFAGQMAKIKTMELLDPDQRGYTRKTFIGELQGLEDGKVCLKQSDKQGGRVHIALDAIDKANLEPQF